MSTRITTADIGSLSPADRAAWVAIQQSDRTFESPYFHPGWSEAVGRHRNVVVAIVRDDTGQPVGFWPLERQGSTATAVGAPLNDYQGCIMRAGTPIDIPQLLAAAGVRRWHFDHLLASQPGMDGFTDRSETSPIMDLTGGAEAYLARISKGGRRQIKSIWKKAERMTDDCGPVRFDADCRDAGVLDQLLEWKSAQYVSTGLPDVFAPRWTGDLLHDLLAKQPDGDAFCGRMAALWTGDRLAAAHFGLRSGPVIHWWFPTYDDDLADYSPGWQLLVQMIDAAQGEGVDRIDLGKGESQFKRKVMTGEVALREGVIEPSALRRTVRRTALELKERLKQTPLRTALQGPARWLFHRNVARTLES